MNTYMKKAVAAALALSVVGSSAVFAQTPSMGGGNSQNSATNRVEIQKVREEAGQKILALFEKFAPQLYDEEVALKAEHESIHQDIQKLHEQIKELIESRKDGVKEQKQQMKLKLKEQVGNGSFDKEAFKAQIKSNKAAPNEKVRSYRDQLKSIREEIQNVRNELETVRGLLREAVVSSDETAIEPLLIQLNGLHNQHVDLDKQKVGVLANILSELKNNAPVETTVPENDFESNEI